MDYALSKTRQLFTEFRMLEEWKKQLKTMTDYDLSQKYLRRDTFDPKFVQLLLSEIQLRGIDPNIIATSEPPQILPKVSSKMRNFLFFLWLRGYIFLHILLLIIGYWGGSQQEIPAYKFYLFHFVMIFFAFPAGFLAYVIECIIRGFGSAAVEAFFEKRYLDAFLIFILILLILL